MLTPRLSFAAGACFILLAGIASAASIAYPDVGPIPPGISFTHISESSATDGVPLYGPPSASTAPVGLHFDPAGFAAFGSGGTIDITDGQLNFTVNGTVGSGQSVGINSLTVNEGGDYTLAGFGTTATQLFAGAIAHVTVTQVDGLDISPISFSSLATFSANLITNPGIVQPWSMAFTVPIAAELTALNIPYTIGATQIRVVIDNQLGSFSEFQSLAAIQKKNFDISVIPDVTTGAALEEVPEPSAVMLLLCGSVPLLALLRRRTS